MMSNLTRECIIESSAMHALKEYQQAAGCGLKEAKGFVESQ